MRHVLPYMLILSVAATSCDWFVTPAMVRDAKDRDGDGYGALKAGGEDCDDTDRSVHPGAEEVCSDGLDNDCDGQVDDFGKGDIQWTLDDDDDGWGTDIATRTACPDHLTGQGWASRSGDCDDGDPQINPGIEDADCDGEDEDCDGVADNDALTTTWYFDGDNDGYGDPLESRVDCAQPEGFVSLAGDCDDTDASLNPGETDLCDNVDNDCDGSFDEDEEPELCYRDGDGDLHGDATDLELQCVCSAGRVLLDDDCDDVDEDIHPGVGEACDGIDNDCDGQTDEAADLLYQDWYLDDDGDGFGVSGAATNACVAPGTNYVTLHGDCDDTLSERFPGNPEVCDDLDNDCNGATDDTLPELAWYLDFDQDGFGDPATLESKCDAPGPLYVTNDEDCDDLLFTVNPNQDEICDDIDNDCTGVVNDGLVYIDLWHDDDNDGLGDPADYAPWCDLNNAEYVTNDLDCNDNDTLIGQLTWFPDDDADGYGDGLAGNVQCDSPTPGSWTQVSGDCDDSTELAAPGLPEVCNDAIDNSCDPSDDCSLTGLISLSDIGSSLSLGSFEPGAQVSWVPDINGDGLAEFAVAYPGADITGRTDAGTVHLYESPFPDPGVGWPPPTGVWFGPDAGASAGASLEGSYDLTGDAIPDLLIGTPGTQSGRGAVYVSTAGSARSETLAPSAKIRELRGPAGGEFGSHVAAVRHVPVPGAISLLGTSRPGDAVYLVYAPIVGSADVAAVADLILEAPKPDLGVSMGDQTGDGVPEIGVAYWDLVGTGFLDVVDITVPPGPTVDMPTMKDYRVETSADLGFQAVAQGDVDGDGLGDWLLGAPEADPLGVADAGTAFLLLSPHGVLVSADIDSFTTVEGTTAGDNVGRSVALADVTGDGTRDLLIGASGMDGNGAVLLFHGLPAAGPLGSGDNDAKLIPGALATGLGWDLSTVNDANGDHLRDLAAAAHGQSLDEPTVYIMYGLGL